jgi:predicted DCC family thiol-disulfide oxidoreductase YuxK
MLDGYSWPWSHWLLNYPRVLQGLTFFVYWLEMIAPLVALSPFFNRPLRFLAMLLLTAMHTGFMLLLAIGFFPFVSLSSLTVLLGGWVWDALQRRLKLGEGLRIYYDRDCAACHSAALVLRMLLLLPRASLSPAQDYPRADTLLRANRSWVVIDRADRAWLKWPALVTLLRASPLFGGLGRLLGAGWIARGGDAVHDFFARHRALGARLAAPVLRPRAVSFEVRGPAQWFAALVMVAALAWNFATVGGMPFGTFATLTPLIYPLRMEQFWQMFAPFPFKDNGWYVLPGKLADGSEVDVLRPAQPLSYDKPYSIALDFPNMRWQVYENRMYDHRFRQHRGYWARYLCREWNSAAAPDKRLLSFNIVYMLMRTPPPGESSHLEQVVLWRHQCVPPDPAAQEGAETQEIPAGPR